MKNLPENIEQSFDSNLSEIKIITDYIEKFPIDVKLIPQNKLDLVNRNRTSLFPWRGQFSPDLIEILLSKFSNNDTIVLDPFVGCGTTLFESANKSLSCFGIEINPAAIEMSRTAQFVNIDIPTRYQYLKEAYDIISKCFLDKNGTLEESFIDILKISYDRKPVYNIIINTIMRYNSFKNINHLPSLFKAFNTHQKIITRQIPYNNKKYEVHHCDARDLKIDDNSIDLIITSPPYINVFNYHQYHRNIMELAGWNILNMAKSEIGSNRKNRGNRYLTVIQYSIDMLQALKEMRRVIKQDGRIIIVIGRESNVRGVSYENYKIISSLAILGASLKLVLRQERKFVTRFGRKIYEDILHFTPTEEINPITNDLAKNLSVYLLNESLKKAPEKVKNGIKSAIEKASDVNTSPIFSIEKLEVEI